MSNLTLYQITEDLLSIQQVLSENGGELTPELEQALDTIKQNFLDKTDDYASVTLNTEAGLQAKNVETKQLALTAKNKTTASNQ